MPPLFEPATVTLEPPRAAALALAERAPVFLPAPLHIDDRGWSLMNLLRGTLDPAGQINFSLQFPGVIKAWHRHQHQTDFWICLQGHIKAGIHRDDDDQRWLIVFGQLRPGVLIIPPTLWHGAATVGDQPAGLLYYVSRAYDPTSPDEQRRPPTTPADFPWSTIHR